MAPSPPCPRRPDARSLRGAFALVVLAAWIHASAFASSVALDVYAGADTTALEPGKLAPRNVVVHNRGTGPVELIEEIGLPRGWSRLATLDEVFALAAGETAVRVVALAVPGNEPEGRKAVHYRLKDRSNNAVVWDGEFPVSVRAVGRLAVSWSELPSNVVAGEPLPLAVTLVNRGNCPVDVEIEGESYPAAGPPLRRKIVVGPGASDRVAWDLPTDPKTPRRTLQGVRMRVSGRWSPDGHVALPDRSWTVEVLPIAPPTFDPYVRLPTTLTTTVGWERGRSTGIQTEWAGRGRLNESGEERVDFRFRGPDAASPNDALRSQDEYGLTLSSTIWDVHFGDRSFGATPLLRSPGNERGLGFDYHRESVEAGGFVAQARGEEDDARTAYGYLGWRGHQGLGFRYGTLRTTSPSAPTKDLRSLTATWNLDRRFGLELEGAVDADAGFSDGSAWRLDASGELGARGGWHASRTESGTAFRGAAPGSTITAIGAFRDLGERLRLTAEWRDHRGAGAEDSELTPRRTDSQETSWRAGPRLRLENGTWFGLDARALRRRRDAPDIETSESERSLVASIGRDRGRFGVEVSEEIGMRSDTTSDDSSGVFSRTSAYGIWRATERTSYTASFQLDAGSSPSGEDTTVQAGLSGDWRIGRSTQASLAVTHQPPTGRRQARTAIQARGSWTLPNRHEVSGTVRVARGGTTDAIDASVAVAYRIPLDLPVGRRRGFGTLQGTVRDGDNAESRPVAKAIVRLDTGETAVTDRDGRFVFTGLKTGEYTAHVDARSLGFGRLAADWTPQRVRVADGSVSTLDIVVVTAATLAVRLTIFEEAPAPAGSGSTPAPSRVQRPAGPHAGEVVELSNGSESYRRMSDGDGAVLFAQLRPGRWSLRVFDTVLPAQHVVERPTREIELAAGDRGREEVRVLPRQRRLRMIDQGS